MYKGESGTKIGSFFDGLISGFVEGMMESKNTVPSPHLHPMNLRDIISKPYKLYRIN